MRRPISRAIVSIMDNKINMKAPVVTIASEPWVTEQIMDTECRIEKAFHEQTRYLSEQQKRTDAKLDNTMRWSTGLFITMTVAIILAVLFK